MKGEIGFDHLVLSEWLGTRQSEDGRLKEVSSLHELLVSIPSDDARVIVENRNGVVEKPPGKTWCGYRGAHS